MNSLAVGLRAVVASGIVAAMMQTMGGVVLSPLADASTTQMTATTAVNVRTGPSTSDSRLGVLYPGQSVEAVSESNGWTKVTYDGRTAYVASAYLRGTAPAPAPAPVPSNPASAYTTANLNLRSGPGTGHSIVHIASKGTAVTLTGRADNGFVELVYKSRTVWASSRYLTTSTTTAPAPKPTTPAPTPPAAVPTAGSARTTANLNIRSGPATSHPIIHIASKGTTVSLTGRTHNGFSEVIYNSKTLWASTRYLTTVQAAPAPSLPTTTKKMRATTALMIRTTNTSSYRSLGDIPRGTIVDATDKVVNGVREIVWQGNVRWVNNRYLVEVSAETTAPTAPALPATSTQYATTVLNIWLASTGTAHSGEVPRGGTIQVTGKVENGRAEAVHNGAIRWFTARYLTATPPSSSSPVTSAPGGDINKGYSSGLDTAGASVQAIAWHVWGNWPQIKTQYGTRSGSGDHPAGRALDIMIPSYRTNQALGQEIAEYYKANAKQFDIHYIIWDQKIWNIYRDAEGWRPMADRGSDSANHIDHVHITTHS